MSGHFSADFVERLGNLLQSHAALCSIEDLIVGGVASSLPYRLVIGMGGFLSDRFMPEISETAYRRLLAKHVGHCHHFEVKNYYTIDTASGQRYDAERHVYLSEHVVEVINNAEWGLQASISHQQRQQPTKSQRDTSERSAASDASHLLYKESRKRTSFMLDKFLRLDLIHIQSTSTARMANDVRESYELQLEYLYDTGCLMDSSAATAALLPALYSVLQILQNSCIPLSQSRRSLIQQSFSTLTGSSMKSFPYAPFQLLQRRNLHTMFSSSTTSSPEGREPENGDGGKGGFLVTDKAADTSPSLIYLFENTVYMYCCGDGLRQITQPNMDIRKWNHSVFVGEYGDHFNATDVVFFQGQSLMGNTKKTTSDRLDTMTMCYNDLAAVYRIPPFGLKKYTFCRTAKEFGDAVRFLFDTYECRGPYTIGGIYILNVHAAYPVMSVLQDTDDLEETYAYEWQKVTSFTLQFANNAMDRSLYASGPHDTICPIDDLQVAQNLFPGRLGLFQFHDTSLTDTSYSRSAKIACTAIQCEFLNLDVEKQQPDALVAIQGKCENFRIPLTRMELVTLGEPSSPRRRLFTTPCSLESDQSMQRETENILFRSITNYTDAESEPSVPSEPSESSEPSDRSETTIVTTKNTPLRIARPRPQQKKSEGADRQPKITKASLKATTASVIATKKRRCAPTLLITPVPRKKASLEQ